MRNTISYAALGVALVAGTSVARAQMAETVIAEPGPTIVAQEPLAVPPPVVVAPPAPVMQTVPVETVETVRTVQTPPHRVSRSARTRTGDRVTTTRTTTVREGVVAAAPAYGGLYDVAAPTPFGAAAPAMPAYRYVYEPDRILVIDPYTNITVQAIPR